MFRFLRRKKNNEVLFEEILLDSSNLPSFNMGRMEGRMELPLSERSVIFVGVIFFLIAVVFWAKV